VLWEIRAYFALSAAHLTVPVDLSTRIEYRRNNVTVASQIIVRQGLPQSALGCTGLGCEDTDVCICDCTPSCICECGPVVITTEPVQASLAHGDEITVILYPAPGAAPESNTSDDAREVDFVGLPLYWQRRIVDVQFVPSDAKGGGFLPDSFYDIWCRVEVLGNNGQQLYFQGRLKIEGSGGAEIADVPMAIPPHLAWLQCTGGCSGANCMFTEVIVGQCGPDDSSLIPCPCRSIPFTTIVPGVQLTPGDEITVILYPAPGAVPPSPPYEDVSLTISVPCPEDCAVPRDGDVDVGDLLAMLAQWGMGGLCDVTGNGVVTVSDLLRLLAEWGPCP
jgi:hypothetical protein